MIDIVIDAETESLADIGLGAYAYNNHPSTDVLCVSWRPLHDPLGSERIWFPGKRLNPAFLLWKFVDTACAINAPPPPVFIPGTFTIPPELARSIARGDRWWAHNAFFERNWWDLVMVREYGWPEVPFEIWHCSAALAAYYGYSQSLERACIGVGTKVAKDTDGGALMKKMSPITKRTKKIIANWESNLYRLGEYCKVDVSAEAGLILALPPLPENERKYWLLDQKINMKGLPLDRELVVAGAKSSDLLQADAVKRLPKLTGGAVKKPGEIAKIQKWVSEQTGEKLPNLQAGTVAQLLARGDVGETVKEVLRIRQDAGTAAIKKFAKESAAISHGDDRFRGGFVYYGAHTGRWTGRIVQPTNMPRAHFDAGEETERGIAAIKSGSLDAMEAADRTSMEAAQKGKSK